jgi:hypothetical protein
VEVMRFAEGRFWVGFHQTLKVKGRRCMHAKNVQKPVYSTAKEECSVDVVIGAGACYGRFGPAHIGMDAQVVESILVERDIGGQLEADVSSTPGAVFKCISCAFPTDVLGIIPGAIGVNPTDGTLVTESEICPHAS